MIMTKRVRGNRKGEPPYWKVDLESSDKYMFGDDDDGDFEDVNCGGADFFSNAQCAVCTVAFPWSNHRAIKCSPVAI